jgi:hypothetical protein
MEWLTLTIGQRNGKLVLDYGFKGYTNINIEKIPNIFNVRSILQTIFVEEKMTTKISRLVKDLVKKITPFFQTEWKEESEKEYTRKHRSINIPVTSKQREKQTITSY